MDAVWNDESDDIVHNNGDWVNILGYVNVTTRLFRR